MALFWHNVAGACHHVLQQVAKSAHEGRYQVMLWHARMCNRAECVPCGVTCVMLWPTWHVVSRMCANLANSVACWCHMVGTHLAHLGIWPLGPFSGWHLGHVVAPLGHMAAPLFWVWPPAFRGWPTGPRGVHLNG